MLRLLALVALAACPCDAAGQAWTRPPGGVYASVLHGRLQSSARFDAAGERVAYLSDTDEGAFTDHSWYLYVEAGATRRLTVVAMVPYKRMSVERGRGRTPVAADGVGTAQLGARLDLRAPLGLADGRAAALQVLLGLPTGYTRNAAPALGTGVADVDVVASAGASFHPLPAYVQAGAGVRLRTGLFGLSRTQPCMPGAFCDPELMPDYDHQWLATAEAGMRPVSWLLVQGLAGGQWSNRPPEVDADLITTAATRERRLQLGAAVTLYPLPHVGLSVRRFGVVRGRNTLAGASWFVGLEVRTD